MLVLLFVVAVLVVSQVVMYRLEGGLKVADSYADPPLSTVFHAIFFEPLAATEKRDPSPFNIAERWFYWRALRKFPTLEYCLISPATDDADAFDFNWKAIRTSEQASLCLHHMSVRLKDPVQIRDWLRGQGFDVRLVSGSIDDGYIAVSGHWNRNLNQKRDPFSLFSIYYADSFDPILSKDSVSINISIDKETGTPRSARIKNDRSFI